MFLHKIVVFLDVKVLAAPKSSMFQISAIQTKIVKNHIICFVIYFFQSRKNLVRSPIINENLRQKHFYPRPMDGSLKLTLPYLRSRRYKREEGAARAAAPVSSAPAPGAAEDAQVSGTPGPSWPCLKAQQAS